MPVARSPVPFGDQSSVKKNLKFGLKTTCLSCVRTMDDSCSVLILHFEVYELVNFVLPVFFLQKLLSMHAWHLFSCKESSYAFLVSMILDVKW